MSDDFYITPESRRLVTRLKFAQHQGGARFRQGAVRKLATGDWIGRRQDLLITGKTEPVS
jgi:hypothetical protein